ncbi:type I restriction enzyme S subunit [Halanaerobium saccharolyticum]|uniref:Type I restriction enzyme S subunit n=1 Tax=Halanaerobium saccharolyticum TaxID=43595 RepID=A0A4R6S784_9FIRM|nr:restriction endonuclease subunit S [Halanaerobium saccharolyticum]TDP94676.1 type I restriction enzyme S subunit [Halanaerobium saccharolyticum]
MVKEGYRNTSIGVIPNDWKVERLSDVGKVTGGNTPRRSTDEYWGGDIPWLTPSQLTGKLINEISETDEYITEKGFENSSVKLLPPGTVIMSSRATIGETVINKVPLTTNQGFANIICDENKVYNYYLLYLLRYITPSLEALAGGSTFLEISRTNVRSVNIPLPPLPEQKKIASILSSVDKSIEKTSEVIGKTKELKKGLMQKLLTKGIGHSEFKEVTVGPFEINVPKEWEVLEFKDVLDSLKSGLSRRLQSEDVGVPVIRSTNMVDGKINFEDIKYWYWDDPKGANVENYLLKDGDILVNFINSMAHIGKACIYRDMGRKAIYTTNVFRTRVNKDTIRNIYFFYYTQSNQYQKEIERISKQAVNQASFTTGDFKNIFIPVPPIKEQEKIASILSSVDAKIKKEEEYKAKLERLKKGLMQKLLTGEIRVNTEMEV